MCQPCVQAVICLSTIVSWGWLQSLHNTHIPCFLCKPTHQLVWILHCFVSKLGNSNLIMFSTCIGTFSYCALTTSSVCITCLLCAISLDWHAHSWCTWLSCQTPSQYSHSEYHCKSCGKCVADQEHQVLHLASLLLVQIKVTIQRLLHPPPTNHATTLLWLMVKFKFS